MKEIRSIEGSEFRILPESRKIEGYALLFNVESRDLGGFKEVIEPNALDGVIEKSDILALYNHNENDVLARATAGSGTLSLEVDEKGLKYSFDAPNTPLGNEVFDAINRGDLRNSSFAFTVDKEGQRWEKRDNIFIRTIKQFKELFDVSPVFRPAYADTLVAVRSLDEVKKELDNMDERLMVEVEVKVSEGEEMEPTTTIVPTTTMEPDLQEDNLDQYFEELDKSVEDLKK